MHPGVAQRQGSDRRGGAAAGAPAGAGKTLVVWDADELNNKLKAQPGLVREFFGPEWVRVFNGIQAEGRAPAASSDPDRSPEDVVLREWLRGRWRSARDADATGFLRQLVAAAGLSVDRRGTSDPSDLFVTARFGTEPERWTFSVPGSLREANVLARRAFESLGSAVDLFLDLNDTIAGPIDAKARRHGLLVGFDSAAASLEGLPSLEDLAAAAAALGPPEVRHAGATRVERYGTFLEQVVERRPGARRFALLRARARAQLTHAIGGVRQYLGRERTVSRNALEEQLDDFLRTSGSGGLNAGRMTPCALIGPQGVGKTSLLCRYFEAREDVAALFIRASELESVFRENKWTLDVLCERFDADLGLITQYATQRPLVVLCIDGLNEADPDLVRRALGSSSTASVEMAGVALVVTCWPTHWRQVFRSAMGPYRTELEVSDFDEDELSRALAARGVSLDSIPEPLRALARRPSLLDAILSLRTRLAGRGAVTRMDVFWADLQFKAEQRWIDAPGGGHALRDHLVQLVRNYQRARRDRPGDERFRYAELARTEQGEMWDRIDRKILTLADFDLVRVDHGTVALADEDVARAAIALLLCDEMKRAGDAVERKIERGRKVLDQIGDLVEPTDATFFALGVALAMDDSAGAEAIAALLCDNRNFDADRLRELGRRLQRALLPIARRRLAASSFEHLTVATARAVDQVVSMVSDEDEGLVRELLAADRTEDASLAHTLAERKRWPALIEPFIEALFRAEHPRPEGEVPPHSSLVLALTDVYERDAVPALIGRLSHRKGAGHLRAKLASVVGDIGDVRFLAPLSALAECRTCQPMLVEALPDVASPQLDQLLRRLWSRRKTRAQAVRILRRTLWLASEATLQVMEEAGPTILEELSPAELLAVVWSFHRARRVSGLGDWALRAPVPKHTLARERLGQILFFLSLVPGLPASVRARCAAAGLALLKSFEGEFSEALADAPFPPPGSARRRSGARPDGQLRCEPAPEARTRELTARFRSHRHTNPIAAAEALRPFSSGMLPEGGPRESELRAFVEGLSADDAADERASCQGAALEYACYFGMESALPLAEALITSVERVLGREQAARLGYQGLATLPLSAGIRASVRTRLQVRHPTAAQATVMAFTFGQTRGPLPAEVEEWLGRAMLAVPEEELTPVLRAVADTQHRGLSGTLARLARRARPELIGPLWLAALSGRCSSALFSTLLERHGRESLFALYRTTFPPARRWLAEQLAAAEVPDDQNDDESEAVLRWVSLLEAARRNNLPVSLDRLRATWTPRWRSNNNVVRDVLALVALHAPGEMRRFLAPWNDERSGQTLAETIGVAWSAGSSEVRRHLLVALCHDLEPETAAPRPSLGSVEDAFAALALHPPTEEELHFASTQVERRWRSGLAWAAHLSPGGDRFLQRMSAEEPARVPREAARHALMRLDQRAALDQRLTAICANPRGALRSRDVVPVFLRLDATHQSWIDALAADSRPDARWMAHWLAAAAKTASDGAMPGP